MRRRPNIIGCFEMIRNEVFVMHSTDNELHLGVFPRLRINHLFRSKITRNDRGLNDENNNAKKKMVIVIESIELNMEFTAGLFRKVVVNEPVVVLIEGSKDDLHL